MSGGKKEFTGCVGIDESVNHHSPNYPEIFVGIFSLVRKEKWKGKYGKASTNKPSLKPSMGSVIGERVMKHTLIYPEHKGGDSLSFYHSRLFTIAELINSFAPYNPSEIIVDGLLNKPLGKRKEKDANLELGELEQVIHACAEPHGYSMEGELPLIRFQQKADTMYKVVNVADKVAWRLNKYYGEHRFNLNAARKYNDTLLELKSPSHYHTLLGDLGLLS